MNSTLFIYFLIETLLLFLIIRRFKRPNALSLGYFVFYIYAQSTYIKYLFSGNPHIKYFSSSLNFSINSDAYLMASTYYFLFMLCYGLIALFIKKDGLFESNINMKIQITQISTKLKIIILFLVFYILLYFTLTFEMDRVLKKQFSILPFDFIFFYLANYFWALLFFYSKNNNKYFYLLTFAVLLHSFYSFEREFIVIVGLVLLFKYKDLFKGYRLIFVFSLAYFVLSYWKAFYIHIIINSKTLYSFFESVKSNSFTYSSETDVGMSLLTKYFENNIYHDYYLSYVTNTYNQVIRIFFNTGYSSLAEFSTIYYTNGRMGTAFSMILESVLNFGFMGPLLLPFIIIGVVLKTLKKNIKLYDFYSVFLIFMLLKLVRTELTVLLKLYILPFLIFLFLMRYFFKKKVKNF